MQFVNSLASPLDTIADLKGCTVDQLLQMTRLTLHHVNQTALPEEIGLLKHVKELHISFAPSKGHHRAQLPSTISSMTALTKLSVENAVFSDFPSVIFECTQLHELIIKYSALSFIPRGLGSLTMLRSLDLSHNMLRLIPKDVQHLRNIQYIDFSYNHLLVQENRFWPQKVNNSVNVKTAGTTENTPLNNMEQDAADSNTTKKCAEPPCDESEMSLPVEMCSLPICSVKLIGNNDISVNVADKIDHLFTKESNEVARSLKMFRILSEIPNVMPALRDSFESHASDIINSIARPDDHFKLDEIIKLTIQNNAYLILEVPIVKDYIQRLWHNNTNIREYLEATGQAPPRLDSFTTVIPWFSFWMVAYYKDIIPRFCKSVRAKYLLSLFQYLLFLVLLLFYVIDKNTTGNVSTYTASSALERKIDVSSITDAGQIWPFIEDIFIESYMQNIDDLWTIVPLESKNISHSYYRPILGFRLRQLRVQEAKCNKDIYSVGSDPTPLQFPQCSPPYTPEHKSKSSYGPQGAFKYKHLCSKTHLATVSPTDIWYECDGFVEFVKLQNKTKMKEVVHDLGARYWIDHLTRFVAIEFVVSFDNIDCLTIGVIHIEILPTGLCNVWLSIESIPREWIVKESVKTASYHIVLLVWAISFFMFQVQRLHLSFRDDRFDSWFLYDMFILVLFSILAYVETELSHLVQQSNHPGTGWVNETQNYFDIAYLWSIEKVLIGWVVLLSFIRLLFYTNVDPSLGPMQSIVKGMLRDILRFFVFLLAFMVAFCTYFFTVYGQRLDNYSSYSKSLYVTMTSIFGGFDTDGLVSVQQILGRIDSYVFSLITIIILLNFLIAILSGTYESVQSESLRQYNMLFCETVFGLKSVSLPPPLNALSPVFRLLTDVWAYRQTFWRKLMPYTTFMRNYHVHIPKSNLLSVWSSPLKTRCSVMYFIVDLLALLAHWIISIVILILLSPFLFAIGLVSNNALDTCEHGVLTLLYVLLLLMWWGSFPLWCALYVTLYPAEWVYTKFIVKPDERKLISQQKGEHASNQDNHQASNARAEMNDVHFSILDEQDYVDIIYGALRLPINTLVSDVPWSGYSRQESMYFNVAYGHGVVGLVPFNSDCDVLPGIQHNSLGFHTKTGCVYFGGKLIGCMAGYESSPGLIVSFIVDYDSNTLTISSSSQAYVVSVPLIPHLQLTPAFRITCPNTMLFIRILKSSPNEKGRCIFTNNPTTLPSGHPKVFIVSFPLILCSFVESPEFFAWQRTEPVFKRDGVQYGFFEFEVLHPGKNNVLVIGFSLNNTIGQEILGEVTGSVRVAIDLSRKRATFVENDTMSGVRTVEANLAKLVDKLPSSFGFVFDYSKARYWFCVNNIVLPFVSGRIKNEGAHVYPGVIFSSPQQYVRFYAGYPPTILTDQFPVTDQTDTFFDAIATRTSNRTCNRAKSEAKHKLRPYGLLDSLLDISAAGGI